MGPASAALPSRWRPVRSVILLPTQQLPPSPWSARANSLSDICCWEPFQSPDRGHESRYVHVSTNKLFWGHTMLRQLLQRWRGYREQTIHCV